jgi:hypothetical protein
MPQNTNKAFEAKKLISASMPINISAADKKKLEAGWDEAAARRNEAVAKEMALPDKHSLVLKYQLQKFGRHWVGYAVDKRGKLIPLLPAPSLFTSACDAVADRMVEDATKA